MKILIICICLYALNQYFVKAPNTTSGPDAKYGTTAKEIDPGCDIVIFTTSSCSYCKRAKKLLASYKVKWCEKNITKSSQNLAVYNQLGGKGVPLTLFGSDIRHGYNEEIYTDVLNRL